MTTSGKTVEELAYELWEARGRPEGSAEQDWIDAERLSAAAASPTSSQSDKVDEAQSESFPASDSPAIGGPDVVPSNAESKWKAAGRANRGSQRRAGKKA